MGTRLKKKKKTPHISGFHLSYPTLNISTHICSNGGGRGATYMLIRDYITGEYVRVLKYKCDSY